MLSFSLLYQSYHNVNFCLLTYHAHLCSSCLVSHFTPSAMLGGSLLSFWSICSPVPPRISALISCFLIMYLNLSCSHIQDDFPPCNLMRVIFIIDFSILFVDVLAYSSSDLFKTFGFHWSCWMLDQSLPRSCLCLSYAFHPAIFRLFIFCFHNLSFV